MALDQVIETRLKLLEAQGRNYRLFFLGLMSCLLILIFMGQSRPQQEPSGNAQIISAKGFVLVDETGKRRAELSMVESEPKLRLYGKDETNKACCLLGFVQGQPALLLNYGDQKVALAIQGEETAVLVARGERNVIMKVATNGPAGVSTTDKDGKLGSMIGVALDGTPILSPPALGTTTPLISEIMKGISPAAPDCVGITSLCDPSSKKIKLFRIWRNGRVEARQVPAVGLPTWVDIDSAIYDIEEHVNGP